MLHSTFSLSLALVIQDRVQYVSIWNAQYLDDMKLLYISATVLRVSEKRRKRRRRKKMSREQYKKVCFNFNLSYIMYSQFVTFNALIGKIQDTDKYVEAEFLGRSVCIMFNERALHRNQCLWCSVSKRQRKKKDCVKMGESFAGNS